MKALVTFAAPAGGECMRYGIAPIDGAVWPAFSPGDHVALVFELPGQGRQSRHYSLIDSSSESDESRYDFVVQKEASGRGGSSWLHANLRPGMEIEIEGPLSHFQLDATERPALFIAGGIGVTPVFAMARACERRGRPFAFYYFARSPQAPLREEARQLRGTTVAFHDGLSVEQTGARLAEILRAHPDRPPVHVCGPQGFIDATLATAEALGWPAADLRFERFAAKASTADKPFHVRLASSGLTVEVSGEQTLLAALAAQGIGVASGCGAGICGSCLVPVIEGRVDHRDQFLSDEEKAEGELMCVCVSRAAGESITIDL